MSTLGRPGLNTPGPNENPFPNPVKPEQPPFAVIPPPDHISIEIWQDSYYDASSSADMGIYRQLPDGPCDLKTGRLIDGEFTSTGPWMQV